MYTISIILGSNLGVFRKFNFFGWQVSREEVSPIIMWPIILYLFSHFIL